jgi:multiple sugar transport system permease protein
MKVDQRKRSGIGRREAWTFRLFILPWVVGMLLWKLIPICFAFIVSFMRWNMVDRPSFIGFDNYRRAFGDPLFWQSLKVTSIYSFAKVPIALALALLVAILLNQKIPGRAVFRTLYFLPSVLNGVAVSILWLFIFNNHFGLLNGMLYRIFGVTGPNWLGSSTWVLPSFVLIGLWGFGQPMLIFLAGLQNVPNELHDAARVDGAGVLRRFSNVTLPMLSPVVFFNLILGIIGAFQVFTSGLIITNGGPNNSSLFYVLYIYQQGWDYLNMGYASALAWILFAVIIGLTLLVVRSSRLWVHYEHQD